MSAPALMNWSGGKNSALALYHALHDPNLRVTDLLTSVNAHCQRVSMHGVWLELLDDKPGVSACGENSEYHSFVFDVPYFALPIPFGYGEKVLRTYQPPANNQAKCHQAAADAPDPYAAGFRYRNLLPMNGDGTLRRAAPANGEVGNRSSGQDFL